MLDFDFDLVWLIARDEFVASNSRESRSCALCNRIDKLANVDISNIKRYLSAVAACTEEGIERTSYWSISST